MDWKKPVPLWSLLAGILITLSLTATLLLLPPLLTPKPDFALVPKNNSVTVAAFHCSPGAGCGSNSTTVTIKPLSNFTGIVSLYASASSPGIVVTMYDVRAQSGPLTLPSNVLLGPATDLLLFAESFTIGNYTITVTASSGTLAHTLVVPVMVQNITATLSPTSLTVARGASGSVQVDIASVNRLEGNLSLTGSVGTSGGTDLQSNVTFAPPSLVLQPGGSARTAATVSVGQSDPPGSRYVIIFISKAQAFGSSLNAYISLTIV